MGFIEFFLTGIGLSMDAFAVAICKGLGMRKVDYKQMLLIALFFGGFQALMPLTGYLLGSRFSGYIERFDHWIAFVLLALIGFNMIKESREEEEEEKPYAGVNFKELLILAVATSIDALAVGVTFAFLQVNIVPAITIIGCTTFVISIAGVYVGNVFGSRYKSRAELTGGVILILIGLKILLEHLGVTSNGYLPVHSRERRLFLRIGRGTLLRQDLRRMLSCQYPARRCRGRTGTTSSGSG